TKGIRHTRTGTSCPRARPSRMCVTELWSRNPKHFVVHTVPFGEHNVARVGVPLDPPVLCIPTAANPTIVKHDPSGTIDRDWAVVTSLDVSADRLKPAHQTEILVSTSGKFPRAEWKAGTITVSVAATAHRQP